MMKWKKSKNWWGTFFLMLGSVCIMGFCVSVLVLTQMGTDPCSAMNYGISHQIGWSFGTYQLAVNGVVLLLVLLLNPRLIGTGTIGNMILVGYTADFFSWIWRDVCHIPPQLPFIIRLTLLIPTVLLFVIAAACYMQSGHGMAPYDALPFAITEKIHSLTGNNYFKIIRLSQDLFATGLGFFAGGEVGIMTVLMVLLLAPIVEWVGHYFEKWGVKKV